MAKATTGCRNRSSQIRLSLNTGVGHLPILEYPKLKTLSQFPYQSQVGVAKQIGFASGLSLGDKDQMCPIERVVQEGKSKRNNVKDNRTAAVDVDFNFRMVRRSGSHNCSPQCQYRCVARLAAQFNVWPLFVAAARSVSIN